MPIDPWSGPTPVSNQFPANEPDGIRKLLDKIKAVELQVREVTSNLLGSAGIRLTKLGMFIDSSLTVGGSQTVNGPLAVHGTAAFDGTTTIGGNAAITGTLSLPAGIIDNAALANPVVPGVIYGSATNFALTTTETTVKALTVVVPAGVTGAAVAVTGRVRGRNPNTTGGINAAGADYLHARTVIGASVGVDLSIIVLGSGSSGVNVAPFSEFLTGLTPGGTIAIALKAWTGNLSWGSDTFNVAELSGSILWFR